jgi:hypothetical protein
MLNTNVGDMPLDIFSDYISDILGKEWSWEYLVLAINGNSYGAGNGYGQGNQWHEDDYDTEGLDHNGLGHGFGYGEGYGYGYNYVSSIIKFGHGFGHKGNGSV